MKSLWKICAIIAILPCPTLFAFEYATSEAASEAQANFKKIRDSVKAQAPQKAEPEESEPKEDSDDVLRALIAQYTQLSSISDKYALLDKFADDARELPAKIEIGRDTIYIEPTGGMPAFTIAQKEDFPVSVKIPSKDEFLKTLPSAYKIKRTCDRNRDGILQEEEVVTLLFDLHAKFESANSEVERRLVLNRYAELLNTLNKQELELTWGKNSKFRLVRDPENMLWYAPDEEPLKKYADGEHPSYSFEKKLSSLSELAPLLLLKELQRQNPCDRPKVIELRLEKYQAAKYPPKDSAEFAEKAAAANSGFNGFIEVKNENGEMVNIPTFITDPQNTAELLEIYDKSNREILEH